MRRRTSRPPGSRPQRRLLATLASAVSTALLALCPAALAGELRYQVRQERLLRDKVGVLAIDERAISFRQTGTDGVPGREGTLSWEYPDIQQLWVSPEKLVVLTYEDRKWWFGADRLFEFYTRDGRSFEDAYRMLKDKLDQRFVAAVADPPERVLWATPVKLLGAIRGSEGMLQVGEKRIVYQTARPGQSRTWRYQDIENISSSGPFQLTVTTCERSKRQYGGLKAFNFQLKQALDERRFNALWMRIQRGKGLEFLSRLEEDH